MPDEIDSDRLYQDARSTLDEIKRLQADRAHRDARRTLFVEGVRNVVQAIENGFPIETLVCSETLLIVPIARRLVRASMGALFRQTFIRTNRPSLRNWVRLHRCRVVGASPDGPAELHRFDYPRPTILVLGGQRQGLSPFLRDLGSDLVRIPMVGEADSLNLAVAGSLLRYEVYRARSAR